MMRIPAATLLLGVLTVALAGCASEGPSDPDAPVKIGESATLVLQTSRQFEADFPGVAPEDVWWRITGSPESGKFSTNGLLTVGWAPGTYLVIAEAPYGSGLAPDTSVVTTVSLRPTTPIGFGAYSVTASANGRVAGADGSDSIWVREGGTTRAAYFPGWPVSIAFSPNGEHLYIAQLTGRVIKIDAVTLTAVDTTMLAAEALHVKVRPTDGTIYVTDLSGWLYRLNPTDLSVLGSVHLANPSSALAFGPGATILWATTTEDGKVYWIDATTLEAHDAYTFGNGTQRLAVSSSGDSVYVAHQTKDSLFIIRPSTHTVTTIPVCCGPQGVAISNDGKRLYVGQIGAAVAHFDRTTMHSLGATATGSLTRDVISAPGSKAIYAAGEVGAVRID